ncbi:MAG: hypothetical protein ACREO1_02730 [Arenimonas sp.]
MQYQLILRFRKASFEQPDEVQSLERALAELHGDSAHVDGYDTGARDINLFIMTAEPASIFRRSKPVLERLALLDKVVAAYRVEGGARFTVIWPLKYGRKFTLL